MAKTPKTKKPALPSVGFVGEAPNQSEWFATNHLAFKDGVLHQLHKKSDGGVTMWWYFPVKAL